MNSPLLDQEAEKIAQKFHEAYEQLAPVFSYSTRKASAVEWKDVPPNNKGLMIATVRQLLNDNIIQKSDPSKKEQS